MRRFLLMLAFLLPLSLLAAEVPDALKPTNRLVNDYSGILSAEERINLESRLVAFNDSTSNQIVVIITPTLYDHEIMELATSLGNVWGVGQKKLRNGLVILIKSKTDDEPYGDVALAPGYGLEGALPDAFCKHIIDDQMIDPLSEGNYYQALTQALDVIEPVCRGEYSFAKYQEDERAENRAALFTFLGMMILIIVIFVLADRYNKKHPHDDNHDGDGFMDDDDSYRSRRGPIFYGGIPRGGFGGGFGSGHSGGFGGFGGGSFGGGGAHGRF